MHSEKVHFSTSSMVYTREAYEVDTQAYYNN